MDLLFGCCRAASDIANWAGSKNNLQPRHWPRTIIVNSHELPKTPDMFYWPSQKPTHGTKEHEEKTSMKEVQKQARSPDGTRATTPVLPMVTTKGMHKVAL
jgi:hypothetical protein